MLFAHFKRDQHGPIPRRLCERPMNANGPFSSFSMYFFRYAFRSQLLHIVIIIIIIRGSRQSGIHTMQASRSFYYRPVLRARITFARRFCARNLVIHKFRVRFGRSRTA